MCWSGCTTAGVFLQTLDYLLSATGLRPFALFTAMGQGIAGLGETAGVSLDDYTERIWQVGQTLKGVAPMQLRRNASASACVSKRDGSSALKRVFSGSLAA